MARWRGIGTRWMVAIVVVVGAVIYSAVLYALSLEEAKERGLVGERKNGYLGLVDPSNREAQQLVRDINEKRRRAYQDIASRDGMNIGVVESLAGEKAFEKTKPGHYIEGPGGWMKK
ncbi:MAG: YdbL family protein [Nitrospira sp.]|nr:YdbL family protein [Nitrospira sp.]